LWTILGVKRGQRKRRDEIEDEVVEEIRF